MFVTHPSSQSVRNTSLYLPARSLSIHLTPLRMRTSAIALLFAAAAVAAPAPALDPLARREAVLAQGTASIDASVYDQGDGYYHAVYNETTAALDVVFTPMAELDELTAVTPLDRRSTHDLAGPHGLTKRATTCSQKFSKDTPTLDRANVQLAHNANNRVYNYNDWGWVCIQSQPSFRYARLIVA